MMDSLEPVRQNVGPKPEEIQTLFGSISKTYDFANDAITFGMARLWRQKLVKYSDAQPGMKVLDCATGTGDLALDFKKMVGPSGTVIGTDFCAEMLAFAPIKAQQKNLAVSFSLADVMALQFESNHFDITSIAYGIRNVANASDALKEMARVTKPNGCVMILETGEITNPVLKIGIRFYFQYLVPKIGGWISGRPEAYQYLQKSSGAFPSGADFCKLAMSTKSFRSAEFKSIMGGASFIYKLKI